ncbi:MAG: YceI family protein [Spirosomaceae bacterium]|nr:YceI family protein [Spirosomataceae bacterium]MDP5138961.1 YceI family protein [Spirosomataceae bacterium]
MKKILLTLTFVSFVFAMQSATGQDWKPTTAAITFKIKHALGAYADGKFGGLAATVNFDADNLSSSSISASVKTATFDTDNSIRDKELKSDEYFDVAKYPTITMKSTSIAKGSGANSYIGTFDLTIKNKTKSIKIPFTFTENGSTGTFQGQFTIDRTEFGVGEETRLLSNDAKISIKLNVKK